MIFFFWCNFSPEVNNLSKFSFHSVTQATVFNLSPNQFFSQWLQNTCGNLLVSPLCLETFLWGLHPPAIWWCLTGPAPSCPSGIRSSFQNTQEIHSSPCWGPDFLDPIFPSFLLTLRSSSSFPERVPELEMNFR